MAMASAHALSEGSIRLPPAPSEDIEHDLRRVLKEDLDFEGQFSFSRVYPNAPNPFLSLDGLGLIGLPLGPSAAKSVIEHCDQAPFGKGERTIINKEVRDTWEMDGGKIQFRNSAWKPFIAGVVRDVCEALGVNFGASKPRARLYKLLLYETGSHFLPHVDTEKEDGMFASIIVVLPSEFTGGNAHTSHCGVETVHNSSKNSLDQTSVLAWYTDVMHEVKPITSGYRFALSYNLMHSTTSLRPALFSADDAITKLRNIFQSWNANQSAPDRIYHLLEHQYSKANLSASALKGVDAHIVAVLDSLARDIGFGLGLGNLELSQHGQAEDTNPYPRKRKKKWGYNNGSDDEGHNSKASSMEFAELVSTTMSVENFVDPDGNRIKQDLESDQGLRDQLKSGGKKTQEYEGYMGNSAGSLDRYYRSSVLVIWPRWSSIGGNSDRRTVGALKRLQSVTGVAMSVPELHDFDYLCGTVRYMTKKAQRYSAFQLLLHLATSHCDASLWQKAVAGCCGNVGSLNSLTLENLQDARQIFGFDALADILRPVILGNSCNTRLEFVENLSDLKEDYSDAAQIDAFVQEMYQQVVDNLQPYRKCSELQLFTRQTEAEGGVQLVRDRLVLQIKLRTSSENVPVLEQYLEWLDEEWTSSPSVVEAESVIQKQVISTLLETLIAFKPLFATKTIQVSSNTYSGSPVPVVVGDANPAVSLVGKCLDYDNPQLAVLVVETMNNSAARLASEYEQAKTEAAVVPDVVFSFIPMVQNLLRTCPVDVSSEMATLAESGVKIKLAMLKENGSAKREDVVGILDFATRLGNIGAIVDLISFGLRALSWNEANWVAYMEEFKSRRGVNEAMFGRHLVDLAKHYAQNVSLHKQTYAYSGSREQETDAATCVQAMKLCYANGGPDAFSILMARILQPLLLDDDYVTTVLIALIPELKNLAIKHGLTVGDEPFATVVRGIVAAWIENVLGVRKPDLSRAQTFTQTVSQIPRCCQHCAEVLAFLRNAAEAKLDLPRFGGPKASHVISTLGRRLSRDDVAMEIVRTTPQGLLATKAPDLVRAIRWESNLAKGRALLISVGDDSKLKIIGGDSQHPLKLEVKIKLYRQSYLILVEHRNEPSKFNGGLLTQSRVVDNRLKELLRTRHRPPHFFNQIIPAAAQNLGPPAYYNYSPHPPGYRYPAPPSNFPQPPPQPGASVVPAKRKASRAEPIDISD
ncbi:hypothetical protein C8F01DRAFT_1365057 [Mycena amicta]|nr:hypothetical protein C8F01DRAFT_1365057 [Mycena amicta]